MVPPLGPSGMIWALADNPQFWMFASEFQQLLVPLSLTWHSGKLPRILGMAGEGVGLLETFSGLAQAIPLDGPPGNEGPQGQSEIPT